MSTVENIYAHKLFKYLNLTGIENVIENKNKRPRGLETLLGHLLDKRMSVRNKLTTIVAVQISLKI